MELWTVWRVAGDRASTVTDTSREEAKHFAVELSNEAGRGVRYVALPAGGSPFDEVSDSA